MAEAQSIRQGDHVADALNAEHWAKFEIRSPLDGVILERNITIGDLVAVGADMFKIGDLTTLGVMANLYEQDLPLVEALPNDQRRWTIYVTSRVDTPGIDGRFEMIGNVIDPRQHTAAIVGWVPNPTGALRPASLFMPKSPPPPPPTPSAIERPKYVQRAIPAVQKATRLSRQTSQLVRPASQFSRSQLLDVSGDSQ